MTDKEVQDATSIVTDLLQCTDPSIEAKVLDDFDGIQDSDPMATLKVTVCDRKWQLQVREEAKSKLQLIQVNDKIMPVTIFCKSCTHCKLHIWKWGSGSKIKRMPSFAAFIAIFTFLKQR